MSSGYHDCPCRDCFEIAIGDDDGAPAMCHECQDAGCDGEGECCAPGAYGCDGDGEPSDGEPSDGEPSDGENELDIADKLAIVRTLIAQAEALFASHEHATSRAAARERASGQVSLF